MRIPTVRKRIDRPLVPVRPSAIPETPPLASTRRRRVRAAAPSDYASEIMAMTDEALIEEAGRRLAAAAPDADIILFGSRARGEARSDSDLDLLVIEPDFARRGEGYGRLRRELRGLDVAIDLVVYRRREADEWRGVPGTFLHRVLAEGRVLAGA
jgi:uncharacterized protein